MKNGDISETPFYAPPEILDFVPTKKKKYLNPKDFTAEAVILVKVLKAERVNTPYGERIDFEAETPDKKKVFFSNWSIDTYLKIREFLNKEVLLTNSKERDIFYLSLK